MTILDCPGTHGTLHAVDLSFDPDKTGLLSWDPFLRPLFGTLFFIANLKKQTFSIDNGISIEKCDTFQSVSKRFLLIPLSLFFDSRNILVTG